MTEFQVASILTVIVTSFVLYRMLVLNLEKHVELLKSELAYKGDYKGRLEELKLFYEEEKKKLQVQLDASSGEKETLNGRLAEVESDLNEVRYLLASGRTQMNRYEALFERQEQMKSRKIEALQTELEQSRKDHVESVKKYRELVRFVKDRYGASGLVEYHYKDNEMELSKQRSQRNRKAKYERHA